MKRLKRIIINSIVSLFFISVLPIIAEAEEVSRHNVKPEEGYVPDQNTAIAIAIAVWAPIYGKEHIENEKPFKAYLKDGIWYISGSLPDWTVGGVAEAEISKDTGCILRISHGK